MLRRIRNAAAAPCRNHQDSPKPAMNKSTLEDDDDDGIEVAAPKAEPLKPLSRNEWIEFGVVFLIGVIVPFGNALQEVIWPESTQHRTSMSFVQDASGTILSLGSISLLMVY